MGGPSAPGWGCWSTGSCDSVLAAHRIVGYPYVMVVVHHIPTAPTATPHTVTHQRTHRRGTATTHHHTSTDDLCLAAAHILDTHQLHDDWDNPTIASQIVLAHTRPDLPLTPAGHGAVLTALRDTSPYRSRPSDAAWRRHDFLPTLIGSPTQPDDAHTADRWRNTGLLPADAAAWRDHGFAAADASRWADTGLTPDAAIIWRNATLSPRAVQAGYRRTRTPLHAVPTIDAINDIWELEAGLCALAGNRVNEVGVVAAVLAQWVPAA